MNVVWRSRELFDRHYRDLPISLTNLADKEDEIGARSPDFVAATAHSGLNQALYDLLAKREQVPVWQLFTNRVAAAKVPLYATINRALAERSEQEYLELVGTLSSAGFGTFKCAPFEAVDGPERAAEKSRPGLAMLAFLRDRFPDLGIRVDFHERFRADDFIAMLAELERLELDWIEEPFALGPDYRRLHDSTALRIAAGELYWGTDVFNEIVDHKWADVIMPDVKHVGGFGPLLTVLSTMQGRVEVSQHNPSGPISTAASLHAAVLYPETVRSLEYAFDKHGSRRSTGEQVDEGFLHLSQRPGWGVAPA